MKMQDIFRVIKTKPDLDERLRDEYIAIFVEVHYRGAGVNSGWQKYKIHDLDKIAIDRVDSARVGFKLTWASSGGEKIVRVHPR